MNACDTNLALTASNLAASNDVRAPRRDQPASKPGLDDETGRPAAGGTALGPADWLGLAAAPTFAVMALLTGASGGPDICTAVRDASPLTGMAAMYLLMSAFHLAPWLKLAAKRRP
jgi:hypothetical protein